MTSQPKPTSFIENLTKFLPTVEKVLLLALFIGAILKIMQIDSSVAKASLMGLSFTFFLFAYQPINIPREDGELLGFSELMGFTILPKVLWISSSISTLGIAFYAFNLGNDGYKSMLIIGGTTLGIGTLLLFAFFVSGVKHIKIVMPILLRAVPLCLVDLYILFM